MASGLSWSVRAMPFFNMTHIRQLMHGTPVYGYGNRDFVSSNVNNDEFYDSDDYDDEYDFESSETREDESKIMMPSFDDLLYRTKSKNPTQLEPKDAETESYGGLSGDSLAFTLVYVSVFSVTLLYVGLKLAKRWRARQSRVSVDQPGTPPPLPPCGHPQCARASQATSPSSHITNLIPYTGLGGAWLPEIMTLQGLPQPQPQIHSTAVCRGRCAQCRTMAQPPPSYTKLFLEEQPPAYTDDVVIKDEVVEESVGTEECNTCIVNIEYVESEECNESGSLNGDQIRTSESEESPLNSRRRI